VQTGISAIPGLTLGSGVGVEADRTGPFWIAGLGEPRRLAGTSMRSTLLDIRRLETYQTAGLAGAGLRQVCLESSYIQEGDLLVVPAKRRRSPMPASQNGLVLLECHPHLTLSLNPGPVLPIFPFAPVGITEIVLVRRTSKFSDSGFKSNLKGSE